MKTVAAAVLSFAVLALPVSAAEHRQEVCDDWAFQHRQAVEKDKAGKLVLHRERHQPAPLIDLQADTLASDRDPTDQVARRTDALLKHLAALFPGEADWLDFRRRLDPLLAAAKVGQPDLTGSRTAGDLYRAVRPAAGNRVVQPATGLRRHRLQRGIECWFGS